MNDFRVNNLLSTVAYSAASAVAVSTVLLYWHEKDAGLSKDESLFSLEKFPGIARALILPAAMAGNIASQLIPSKVLSWTPYAAIIAGLYYFDRTKDAANLFAIFSALALGRATISFFRGSSKDPKEISPGMARFLGRYDAAGMIGTANVLDGGTGNPSSASGKPSRDLALAKSSQKDVANGTLALLDRTLVSGYPARKLSIFEMLCQKALGEMVLKNPEGALQGRTDQEDAQTSWSLDNLDLAKQHYWGPLQEVGNTNGPIQHLTSLLHTEIPRDALPEFLSIVEQRIAEQSGALVSADPKKRMQQRFLEAFEKVLKKAHTKPLSLKDGDCHLDLTAPVVTFASLLAQLEDHLPPEERNTSLLAVAITLFEDHTEFGQLFKSISELLNRPEPISPLSEQQRKDYTPPTSRTATTTTTARSAEREADESPTKYEIATPVHTGGGFYTSPTSPTTMTATLPALYQELEKARKKNDKTKCAAICEQIKKAQAVIIEKSVFTEAIRNANSSLEDIAKGLTAPEVDQLEVAVVLANYYESDEKSFMVLLNALWNLPGQAGYPLVGSTLSEFLPPVAVNSDPFVRIAAAIKKLSVNLWYYAQAVRLSRLEENELQKAAQQLIQNHADGTLGKIIETIWDMADEDDAEIVVRRIVNAVKNHLTVNQELSPLLEKHSEEGDTKRALNFDDFEVESDDSDSGW